MYGVSYTTTDVLFIIVVEVLRVAAPFLVALLLFFVMSKLGGGISPIE